MEPGWFQRHSVEVADFCGLASCGYAFGPVGPNAIPPIEQDLSEFFDVLGLAAIPPEEALIHKISVRRAWVCAKASMLETPKQREEKNAAKSD